MTKCKYLSTTDTPRGFVIPGNSAQSVTEFVYDIASKVEFRLDRLQGNLTACPILTISDVYSRSDFDKMVVKKKNRESTYLPLTFEHHDAIASWATGKLEDKYIDPLLEIIHLLNPDIKQLQNYLKTKTNHKFDVFSPVFDHYPSLNNIGLKQGITRLSKFNINKLLAYYLSNNSDFYSGLSDTIDIAPGTYPSLALLIVMIVILQYDGKQVRFLANEKDPSLNTTGVAGFFDLKGYKELNYDIQFTVKLENKGLMPPALTAKAFKKIELTLFVAGSVEKNKIPGIGFTFSSLKGSENGEDFENIPEEFIPSSVNDVIFTISEVNLKMGCPHFLIGKRNEKTIVPFFSVKKVDSDLAMIMSKCSTEQKMNVDLDKLKEISRKSLFDPK